MHRSTNAKVAFAPSTPQERASGPYVCASACFPVVATAGEDLYLGSARTVSATRLSGRELPDSGAHRVSSRPVPDCSSSSSHRDHFFKIVSLEHGPVGQGAS